MIKNKYYIDENGTVRKIKSFLLFPRHNGKTFSYLKQVLPLVRTRGEKAIITLDEFVDKYESISKGIDDERN